MIYGHAYGHVQISDHTDMKQVVLLSDSNSVFFFIDISSEHISWISIMKGKHLMMKTVL